MTKNYRSAVLHLIIASVIVGCVPDGGSVKSGPVKRGMVTPPMQNDLKQLALFYRMFTEEKGQAPADLVEFAAYIRKDFPQLVQVLGEGRYVIVWKSKLSSNVVLAYEKEPDVNGKQMAVMGDATVRTITSAELQAALKATQ